MRARFKIFIKVRGLMVRIGLVQMLCEKGAMAENLKTTARALLPIQDKFMRARVCLFVEV
jgi:hypothetical protein